MRLPIIVSETTNTTLPLSDSSRALFFMEMRARENLRGIRRLKSLTTVSALHELYKGVRDSPRVAIGEGVDHLVRDRARLTQVSVRTLFYRLRGVVELQMAIALDLVHHFVQIRDLNRNMIDVVPVQERPGHVVVLLLDSLIVLIGFDLLVDGLLVLTQEHAETGVFEPDGVDAHVWKAIQVGLLTESEVGVIGQ